ncbi:hypothetical protein CJF30_00001814 [Rutstroemia sp. NJR-2017a BBW]|nr:hypothetical protein CJF30_00001814 [Rutstroemia sp. NJR-2017a BBW]
MIIPYIVIDDTVPFTLWGFTELLVSMACGTIPVLRPLYKLLRGQSKSSDGGSGPSNTARNTGPKYALGSVRHNEFPHSAAGDSERGFTSAGMDNASDESILRDAWKYGITETIVVDIVYKNNDEINDIEESYTQ